jgi:hypothetical protein
MEGAAFGPASHEQLVQVGLDFGAGLARNGREPQQPARRTRKARLGRHERSPFMR